MPGGAPADLAASAATRVLSGVHPAGLAETARKNLARDIVSEIRDSDQRLKTLTAQIAQVVEEHGSRLPAVDGIGPVIAGRLLGPDPPPAGCPRRRPTERLAGFGTSRGSYFLASGGLL